MSSELYAWKIQKNASAGWRTIQETELLGELNPSLENILGWLLSGTEVGDLGPKEVLAIAGAHLLPPSGSSLLLIVYIQGGIQKTPYLSCLENLTSAAPATNTTLTERKCGWRLTPFSMRTTIPRKNTPTTSPC